HGQWFWSTQLLQFVTLLDLLDQLDGHVVDAHPLSLRSRSPVEQHAITDTAVRDARLMSDRDELSLLFGQRHRPVVRATDFHWPQVGDRHFLARLNTLERNRVWWRRGAGRKRALARGVQTRAILLIEGGPLAGLRSGLDLLGRVGLHLHGVLVDVVEAGALLDIVRGRPIRDLRLDGLLPIARI